MCFLYPIIQPIITQKAKSPLINPRNQIHFNNLHSYLSYLASFFTSLHSSLFLFLHLLFLSLCLSTLLFFIFSTLFYSTSLYPLFHSSSLLIPSSPLFMCHRDREIRPIPSFWHMLHIVLATEYSARAVRMKSYRLRFIPSYDNNSLISTYFHSFLFSDSCAPSL